MTSIAPAALITFAIINAQVFTGDDRQPMAEAVAVAGDRIAAVGSNAAIRKLASGAARVIDAHGAMVVPGFIDSHVHFLDGGFALQSVKLRDAGTKEEFIRRIAAYARTVPAGTWIRNGDWDHENWGGELPRRDWIDAVTRDHPVWINRLDGHMGLGNSAALRAAGVTAATPEGAGGTIVRDGRGEPTGILKDNAMALIERAIPDPSPEQKDRALAAAMRYVAEQGVTSVHHMGTWDDLAVFRRARAAGTLTTRVYAFVPLSTWQRLATEVKQQGRGDDWLRIGGLKGFVDGSIGSHTAAMLDPFTDAPSDRGLLINTPEELYAWTAGADRAGLQVAVHAIGDRAIRLQLDIFERVASENGPRDRRFRIEHAQHIAPADLPRFAALGVIASMQPYHAIDDGRWVDKVIGPERAKGTYAFLSLLSSGAVLAFGSDWYVAPPLPLLGIDAAVTRRTLDGRNPGGWHPEQRITAAQALRAYNSAASFAGFAEGKRGVGRLQAGMLADLVLLDRDLLRIPAASIRDAKVLLTMAGGQIVYERASMHPPAN